MTRRHDTDIEQLRTLLLHLRDETQQLGLPLAYIEKVKTVEEVVIRAVEQRRGLR